MPKPLKTSASGASIKPLSVNCGELNISVDPRVELLVIIQYLAGSNMVEKDSYGYAEAIDKWFAPYRTHPVLEHLRIFETRGFAHDLPVTFFLQYEGIPLSKTDKVTQPYMQAMNKNRLRDVGKKAELKAFEKEVNDFVHSSGFALFFQKQKKLFKPMLATAEALLREAGIVETMVEWYGYKQHSYNFIVSPLQGCGGYGLGFESGEGGCDLYCISALQGKNVSEDNLLGMASMLYHEFSHTYINPLVDEHYSQIKKAKKLHKPIEAKLAEMAYPSWWIVVVEHYVRAATIRLMESNTQLKNTSFGTSFEEGQGFIYISHFLDSLALYEAENSQTGIALNEYFPVIVNSLVAYAKLPHTNLLEKIRFCGPLGGLVSYNSIIIIPDPDLNPGVKEYIMPDVNFMVERFRARVYTDTQALELRFPDMDIYAYGTLQDNKWLRRIADSLPFKVLPDMVIADQIYTGTDLRIISCLPNPDDAFHGMGIYTAQTMQAMKNSNTVFHGPEDFVVSDCALNILGKGDYDKTGKEWQFKS